MRVADAPSEEGALRTTPPIFGERATEAGPGDVSLDVQRRGGHGPIAVEDEIVAPPAAAEGRGESRRKLRRKSIAASSDVAKQGGVGHARLHDPEVGSDIDDGISASGETHNGGDAPEAALPKPVSRLNRL